MSTTIYSTNGFRALAALRKVATDPRVEEIEGEGLDDGRVFIHLRPGFVFDGEGAHCRSVGSATELRYAVSTIAPCSCTACTKGAPS